VAFLVSLLQITVPLAGVLLLLTAVVTTGMVGPQTTAILEALAGLAVAVYVSLWLAGRLFRDDADAAFAICGRSPSRAPAARRVVVTIGVSVGLALVMETLTGLDQVAPAAHGVLQLPVYRCWRICSGAPRVFSGPISPSRRPMSFPVSPRAP
jgi:potassium efflux system protein